MLDKLIYTHKDPVISAQEMPDYLLDRNVKVLNVILANAYNARWPKLYTRLQLEDKPSCKDMTFLGYTYMAISDNNQYYMWLTRYMRALVDEYMWRQNKVHDLHSNIYLFMVPFDGIRLDVDIFNKEHEHFIPLNKTHITSGDDQKWTLRNPPEWLTEHKSR